MHLLFYSYRIIHRRVIWLVGQWVGVKLSASLRPVLYQAILPLLQKDEDLVVRIEAANTLKLDILYIICHIQEKIVQYVTFLT